MGDLLFLFLFLIHFLFEFLPTAIGQRAAKGFWD